MIPNRMKSKLLSGQPAFGVSVMFPSPHIVDIVGRLGFDWVLIDCEHGSISLESVELMVMAAETAGVTPIARPPVNSFESIGQLMDRGVMGVQVPHVNTAEDARRAVESVKYHPLGNEGLPPESGLPRTGMVCQCPSMLNTPTGRPWSASSWRKRKLSETWTRLCG